MKVTYCLPGFGFVQSRVWVIKSTTAALLQIDTLYYKEKLSKAAFCVNSNNVPVPSDIEEERKIGAKHGMCKDSDTVTTRGERAIVL